MLNGTYDFNLVNLIFGTREIEGFEDGTEITAERDEDAFTKKVDVDGGVTRSKTNNKTGTVTFSLSQFSPLNKYLSQLANLDERTGVGVLPLKIVDKSNPNEEKAIATQAWVRKQPSKSFGRESGAREWVIDCADLTFDIL